MRPLVFLPFLLVSLALILVVRRFERIRPRPRDVMPVVVLAALAVIGRLLFEAVPNFQPSTAIIIIAGLYFGKQSGLLCGMTAALVSNMFAGQGLWTPWQMLCWGAVGYGAGALATLSKNRGSMSIFQPPTGIIYLYAAFASLAYGVIMDTQYFLTFAANSGWGGYLVTLAAGIPFNLAHVISTLVFLAVTLVPWGKKLHRLKTKYTFREL